ncbi:MAG: AAA family ATPase [Alphaproteobacteria bacterium]|nr:AAA family ATPase [Alphaproteobacteria bacterium]
MKPYIIVFGNEKGGTGKSTIAMHIAVYLLNLGCNVGTIDIDARQGTFTHYFDNRKRSASGDPSLKMPKHIPIFISDTQNRIENEKEDRKSFENAMRELSSCNFIVIDTPGNNTFLSRLAHSYANTLVTPINDSFVDLDVIVKISNGDLKNLRPSVYAEMVWDQRKERAKRGEKPLDWIVVKNRLSTLYTKNRGDVNTVLEALAKRLSFRLGNGFCERVIFKELFLSGTTLLDLKNSDTSMNLSHVAARQELRELISLMKLPISQELIQNV